VRTDGPDIRSYRVTLPPMSGCPSPCLSATGKAVRIKLLHARSYLKPTTPSAVPVGSTTIARPGSSVRHHRGVRKLFVGARVGTARGRKKQDKPVGSACRRCPRIASDRPGLLEGSKGRGPDPSDSGDDWSSEGRGFDLPGDGRQTLAKTEIKPWLQEHLFHPVPRKPAPIRLPWRNCWRCTTGPLPRNARMLVWTRLAKPVCSAEVVRTDPAQPDSRACSTTSTCSHGTATCFMISEPPGRVAGT